MDYSSDADDFGFDALPAVDPARIPPPLPIAPPGGTTRARGTSNASSASTSSLLSSAVATAQPHRHQHHHHRQQQGTTSKTAPPPSRAESTLWHTLSSPSAVIAATPNKASSLYPPSAGAASPSAAASAVRATSQYFGSTSTSASSSSLSPSVGRGSSGKHGKPTSTSTAARTSVFAPVVSSSRGSLPAFAIVMPSAFRSTASPSSSQSAATSSSAVVVDLTLSPPPPGRTTPPRPAATRNDTATSGAAPKPYSIVVGRVSPVKPVLPMSASSQSVGATFGLSPDRAAAPLKTRGRLRRRGDLPAAPSPPPLSDEHRPPPRTAATNDNDTALATLMSEFPGLPVSGLQRMLASSNGNVAVARSRLVFNPTAALDPAHLVANGGSPARRRRLYSNNDDSDQGDETRAPPPPAKKFRRLLSSRSGGSLGSKGDTAGSSHRPSAVSTRTITPIELPSSDDATSDLGRLETDSDAESDPEGAAALVTFFNSASEMELMEHTQASEDQAAAMVRLRPYVSRSQLAAKFAAATPASATTTTTAAPKKRGRQSGSARLLPARLIENYETIAQSLVAIDDVIAQCERIGEDLDVAMAGWPVYSDAASAAVSTAADLASKSAPAQNLLATQPAWMSTERRLKGYQIVGVSWLALLHRKKLAGILADDMGLGKTAQVIAYILHMHENGHMGPFLVVCPSSTLDNWLREFSTWTNLEHYDSDVRVEAYTGSIVDRRQMQEDILAAEPDDRPTVIVTTYHVAVGNHDRGFLRKMRFSAMILDEGHAIKNVESQRYKHLMSIRAQFRVLLTGTPLQNNLHELLALLIFILPNIFAPAEKEWRQLLKLKSISHISAKRLDRVKKIMMPFVLRRKKLHVLADLPPKTVRVEYCTLPPNQRAIYDGIMTESRRSMVAADTPSNANNTNAAAGGARKVKNYLMDLRKAALHPLLFRRHYPDAMVRSTMVKALQTEEIYWDVPPERLEEELLTYSDFDLHGLCHRVSRLHKHLLTEEHWMASAKVAKLVEVLAACKERGDRCLVFSQFTMVLDILEAVMETVGHKYVRLDGATQVAERQGLIDEFHEDEEIFIFLLSTRAGGLGLNLAAANVVILHDLDFNPFNDSQAEDRAWRLGQTKPVEVIKLVCRDTIEDLIYQRQQAKLDLDQRLSATDPAAVSCEREVVKLLASQLGAQLDDADIDTDDANNGVGGGPGVGGSAVTSSELGMVDEE
ncbi:SNF2 family N-terminal domain-containing protein [Blastocladiella britannica]|nr:SNF2 family N-terminal domain-containing protein [Blastocladiella britannica]